ncbi:MAG TPA: lipopolysaccharide assembly protein LapA domain-containing protein [Methylomirabilota bacterium]|nr:lipopolysaccharide assembly protein LapA domain-containing protein [Methylomirabilota bacterium]
MIIIYLLMALLGSLATIFALQNRDPVEIWFLTWSVTGMPLALVILLSLLLGVVFASLSGLVKILKLRYRIRQLEGQVSQLIASQASSAPSPSAPHTPQDPSLPA